MRGSDAAWVGWACEPDPAPEPFRDEGLYLHPVSLSPVEIEEYYEGFANDTLWPIYHDVIVPATFHRNWWNTYRTINHRFAQAISEVAAPGATVWIHDYQLQRLADLSRPSDIAERLPKVLIHRNVPGEPVHAYLAALDDAWARQASQAVYGVRQRFMACAAAVREQGWPLLDGPSRWRLGEITVAWSAVQPLP